MELSYGDGGTRAEIELYEAVCRGDLLHAAFLIDSGLDVNLRTSQEGWSLLHWACKYNNIGMVSLLISRGADKLLKSKSGQIPRDLCTSVEVAALLQAPESPCKTPYCIPNDLPHNMINRSELMNQRITMKDILLKVRIANSSDSDFIEVELPQSSTYQYLVTVCCQELEIHPDQVSRIRKLPDTRVRSDADVRRLKHMQELEVVLLECQLPTSNTLSSNIYPSISANKDQTVLY